LLRAEPLKKERGAGVGNCPSATGMLGLPCGAVVFHLSEPGELSLVKV